MRKKQGIEVGGSATPKKNVNGPRVGSANGPKSIVAEKGDGLAALFGNKKAPANRSLSNSWCGRKDLNLHGVAPIRT